MGTNLSKNTSITALVKKKIIFAPYYSANLLKRTMTNESKNQPILDIEGAFGKTESYIENNRKSLLIIVGGIVLLAGIYFGWSKFYLEPRSQEAAAKMYKAEMYFAKDSFQLAINGNGEDTAGFISIVEDYGMTASGNLAKYYLGISYLRTGQYDKSIEALESFSSNDQFLSSMAFGLIGDAHMEKGEVEEAIEYYKKAAKENANKFSSPIYLKKVGLAYEDKGQKEDALKAYEQIKTDFPESQEATQIDKFIVRVGGTVK